MATRVDVGPGDNGERLPWLEAVEDGDEREGPGAAKLIGTLTVGLLAIAAIVGGGFYLGRDDARTAGGQPELIRAEPGPYKVKPEAPGGMKVEGRGDAAFAASEGADPQARIDLGAVPEAPVAVTQPAPAPQRAQAAAAEAGASVQPVTPPAVTGGASVQLGAFSSDAAAQAAWKALSGRFAVLAPLSHSVEAATVNGRSVYRLRASAPTRAEARELCGRLAVAGESCVLL